MAATAAGVSVHADGQGFDLGAVHGPQSCKTVAKQPPDDGSFGPAPLVRRRAVISCRVGLGTVGGTPADIRGCLSASASVWNRSK